jgi:hypothetical protein
MLMYRQTLDTHTYLVKQQRENHVASMRFRTQSPPAGGKKKAPEQKRGATKKQNQKFGGRDKTPEHRDSVKFDTGGQTKIVGEQRNERGNK